MFNMISVAMTTYNGEKFVEKQLLSILKQTRKPDEVIIVDDCSTDNTVKLVNSFIEDNALYNWKLFILPTNGGFIKSFNEAISKISGDIIFLCDQDDIWLPNKIEIMSELMLMNPRILSLASSFKKIDANDKELVSRSNPFSTNNNLIRKKIKPNKCVKISPFRAVAYNVSPGCTCAFRSSIKAVFSKLNDEHMGLVHDWKINLIAGIRDGLYFLNTPTILYRLHNNNSLGLNRSMTVESRIEACKKSAIEREYMKRIIQKFIEEFSSIDSCNNEKLYNYSNTLQEILLKRQEALKNQSILQNFNLLFKYNLFKNRIYESLLVDMFAIIKSFL